MNTTAIHQENAAFAAAAVDFLDGAADQFQQRNLAVFDGQASRFAVLNEAHKRATPLFPVRDRLVPTAGAETCIQFWRLNSGDYVLPTPWSPGDGSDGGYSSLRVLLLTDSPPDALTMSTESGATTFSFRAGRLVEVHEPCMFWIAPVQSGPLYAAVSGLSQPRHAETLSA